MNVPVAHAVHDNDGINMIAGDFYGIICELAANSVDNCSMRSPQNVPDATTPTCLVVEYSLSSEDLLLTADIVDAGDNVVKSETFRADRTSKYIRLSDLPSLRFAVNFLAKRLMTSEHRTENASVVDVKLEQCHSLGESRDDHDDDIIINNTTTTATIATTAAATTTTTTTRTTTRTTATTTTTPPM